MKMVFSSIEIFSKKFKNQLLATLCANILTFSHGITLAWYVPTLIILQSDKSPLKSGQINVNEVSWIGSLICIGGLIGNFAFGFLINYLGRQKSLLVLGLPQMCSWIIVSLGNSVYYLYAARIFAGMTGGGIFTIIPVFIAEIADKSIRGTLSAMFTLLLSFGMLFGYILGAYVPYNIIPFIIIGAPIVYSITMYFFPETPQFLIENKKDVEALVSYKFYQNISHDESNCNKKTLQSFNEDFMNFKISIRGDETTKDNNVTFKDFVTPTARKGIIISITLLMLSQFAGAYSLVTYTANIFQEVGATNDPKMSTIIVGIVQVLGTYVSTILVDRIGRKILLIASTLGMALGLGGMSGFSHASQYMDLSAINWLPVICVSFAVFAASVGIGPLPFVVMTEVIPLKIRSRTASLCMVSLSFLAFINLKIYPIMMDTFQLSGAMLINMSACILGTIFVITYVPETKGKSLIN